MAARLDRSRRVTAETVHGNAALEEPGMTFRAPISLHFDTADACAVKLTFTQTDAGTQPVSWVFARSLLRNALNGHHAGLGDIRLWLGEDGTRVYVAISSPEGRTLCSLPAALVRLFVKRIYRMVPPGAETFDVEAVIAGCLSGRRRGW